MKKIIVRPTSSGLWCVEGGGFGDLLRRARECEDWAAAADMRFDGVQSLLDAIGEEDVALDWNDGATRAAMELIYASAVDNFLVGDVELAAAQLELLLECDSEDHTEATPQLALCYVALEEWECLEDILPDLGDKSALRPLLEALAEYAATGVVSAEKVSALRRHRHLCEELSRQDHPADEAYLKDISSERPSQQAQAREIYLRCEPLFAQHPDFIPQLSIKL